MNENKNIPQGSIIYPTPIENRISETASQPNSNESFDRQNKLLKAQRSFRKGVFALNVGTIGLVLFVYLFIAMPIYLLSGDKTIGLIFIPLFPFMIIGYIVCVGNLFTIPKIIKDVAEPKSKLFWRLWLFVSWFIVLGIAYEMFTGSST